MKDIGNECGLSSIVSLSVSSEIQGDLTGSDVTGYCRSLARKAPVKEGAREEGTNGERDMMPCRQGSDAETRRRSTSRGTTMLETSGRGADSH